MYALHSRMSMLDDMVETEVKCLDSNVNNAAFVRATEMIGGRDAIEEFIKCGTYSLASSFGIRDVTGTTAVSKVETLLLVFPMEPVAIEDASRFLLKVEMDAKRFLCSFGPKEHDALVTGKLMNGGHFDWVFEQMGISYAPPPPSAARYQSFPSGDPEKETDMSKKTTSKKPKVA
jgi:hypothetical protein